MNELQRQQYLDALGIDSYMPRWVLPMAPAPVLCQPVTAQPERAGSVPPQPVATEVMAQTTPAPAERVESAALTASAPQSEASATVADARQVLAAMATPTPAAEPSTDTGVAGRAVAPLSAATANAETPRFALSLWRIGASLMVIDSRQAELALPTEPLLSNILLALGFPQQRLPRAEVMRWPMYENHLAPQGEEAARETIVAMLEALLEQQPVPYLLLMGADACHYVLPPGLVDGEVRTQRFAAAQGQTLTLEALNSKAIVVPSLCDMLQDTSLKASCWQAIQPLRQS